MNASRPLETLAGVLAVAAVILLLFKGAAEQQAVDPDVWHEMALFREAQRLGSVPQQDLFAYTPTVNPVVHHEWGMGAVLTAVAKPWGLGGLAALRYGLALATLAVCMWCARRRGASLAIICPLLIPGLFFSRVAFSPVRAQAVTLFMLACLLFFLDADRRGRRAWALPWLVLYVVWLNVHGGFAAGLILFAAHAVEQTVRRAPSLHLWGLLAAMVALIAVNPYGAHYYSYLWTGLLMDRPLVEEWASLWHSRADIIAIYVLSLGVLAYVCWRLGPRQPVAKVLCCRKRGISGQVEAAKRGESVVDSVSFANKELARKARSPARMTFATGCWALPGLPLVLLTAWAGFSHQRHLSLFAVAWMAYVPGYVAATPLGERLTLLARRRPGLTAAGWGLLGLAASTAWALAHPWHVAVPGRMTAQSKTQYPVGAVDYLSRMGFTGRLMTHYNDGAYVSWKLHPQVKVAMDGRYEVAYPHAVVDDVSRLYAARSGWQALLDKYPSDAVLVRGVHALSAALSAVPAWRRVYRDDAYEIYAHPDLVLPPEDRRGQELEASFP